MRLEQQKDKKDAATQMHNLKIGQILIKEGLITDSRLRESIRIQNRLKTYKPIGQILVYQKAITQNQLNQLLDRYRKRPFIGDILIQSRAVTKEQLEKALDLQKKEGIRIGETLVKLKLITEEAMRKALCMQLNISYINLENISVDLSLGTLISRNYAQKHMVVPVAKIGDTITLAMDDPTDSELIEETETFFGHPINVVTSTQENLKEALLIIYEDPGRTWTGSKLELIEEDSTNKSKYLESQKNRKADNLVSQILVMALNSQTSDIHIESLDNRVLIRFRIDGMLLEPDLEFLKHEINELRREIISRIKILGKLDIAEKRRPQDGSFRARLVKDEQPTDVDFRISIIPGYYGENVVLRILDNRKIPKSIHELGFSKKTVERLTQLLERNSGIILITGPTGSGKSSTLYGALMTLYRPEIKVLTAEDPIEYVYDNITQCEVNNKIGNTFANYVRSFLRQDPEVIMIGEIRDVETAEMAFRAAQTGHLVLSTLHTNDAVSAVTRLTGLKVDPNLITSCLLGVASQRLVRKICTNCKEEYTPSKELQKEFFCVPPSDIRWFRGQKCPDCNHTGYKGRFGVAELWVPNQNDVILINRGASIDELRESSCQSTTFMSENAMEKLLAGKTNLEELIRTLPYSNIPYSDIHQSNRVLAFPQGNAAQTI